MRHSDQVVTFIETSVNAAKPKDRKRTEYRVRTTRGNIMEHLVLEVSPPAGKAKKPRRTWRVHYDIRERGTRARRKVKIGDTNSSLSAIEAQWRKVKTAIDEGRDWQTEENVRLQQEASARVAYTVRDLAKAYIERHAKPRKKSWKDDQRKLHAYILPAIGDKAASDVSTNPAPKYQTPHCHAA